jgi:hypothetical protein
MNHLSDVAADPQPDLAHLLTRDAFHQTMLILRGSLPPPVLDEPANWARRDRAAMAAVAALLPINAAEGGLAAEYVAACAWTMDCMRLAGEHQREPDVALKCRAQAISLMRESKGSLRALQKQQALRQLADKDETTAGLAAWIEHAAATMMAAALEPASQKPCEEPEAACDGPPPALAEDAAPDTAEADSVSVGENGSSKTRFETQPGFTSLPIPTPTSAGLDLPILGAAPRDQ